MAQVFIFHGVQGHPEENWFPWLKRELERAGHHVFIPAFPRSDHPKLREWFHHFDEQRYSLNGKTVFVGHSLGCAFALRLLERTSELIRATFLAAPVWGVMDNAFDPLMASFTSPPYDWSAIQAHAGKISILHSKNDPYITLEKTEKLQKYLSADVMLIENGGHLNDAAGYTSFPELLKAIKDVL